MESASSLKSPEPQLAINVRQLAKRFGRMTAVEDVTFQMKPGEIVGFLGPNGAGKSTTMRILAGLMVADAGEAYVMGENVAVHPERIKARLAYMPENNPLPEDMRVSEYLRFRACLKRIPRKLQSKRSRCDGSVRPSAQSPAQIDRHAIKRFPAACRNRRCAPS